MALDKQIMERLVGVVGEDYCSDADFVVHSYAKSVDPMSERRAPAAVVIPKSTEEVSEVVKIANEFKTPIIPRGTGIDLTMGTKPTKEGVILLDLQKKMNKILNIDTDHMVVTVEPGVQWGQLASALLVKGYFPGQFGPANSTGSIGGGVSNNSIGGGGEAMYGGPGRLVVSMEVVLPTGEIINTGSAAHKKGKPWFGGRFLGGPDLTGLFIGDPGILGIKTKISLQIFPMPPFWLCKTYLVPGDNRLGLEGEDIDLSKDIKNSVEIFKDLEKIGNPGIHSEVFFNYMYFNGLAAMEYYEPWTRALEPGKINQNGALCIALCAHSQEEMDANLKKVEEVLERYDCQVFGETVEEGNYTQWMLFNMGGYKWPHWLWGSSGGPGGIFNIVDMPWDAVAPAMEAITQLYSERLAAYQDAQVLGPATVVAPVGGGVKIGPANPTRDEIPEIPDKGRMRKEISLATLKCFLDAGGLPIWTGPLYSQFMVEQGYYDENWLALLKTIKDAMDPNGILSPGKFHFND